MFIDYYEYMVKDKEDFERYLLSIGLDFDDLYEIEQWYSKDLAPQGDNYELFYDEAMETNRMVYEEIYSIVNAMAKHLKGEKSREELRQIVKYLEMLDR